MLGKDSGRSGALASVSGEARLAWTGRVVAGALAAGMLVSPALWLGRTPGDSLSYSFPLVPPLPVLGILALPSPLDTGLYGAVLALCALAVVLPGRRLVLGALFALLLLITLPDLMRWQPWVYLYGLALATLVLPGRSGAPRTKVTVLRIIVASVYLYSGLNKVNASFFGEGLRGFLSGLPGTISSGPVADTLTYSAPVLEIAAGAGLLIGGLAGIHRVRYAAIALAASTNLFVLVALILASANVVVWPWNVAMILLIVALFAGRDKKEGPSPQPGPPGRTSGNVAALRGYTCALVIVIITAVMPVAGVLGYWPSYLSYALYSENTAGAVVDPPGHRGPAPATVMSYEQLGVPAFPSPAVYEKLGKHACGGREVTPAAPGSSREPVLIIRSRPDILSGARETRKYSCSGAALFPPGDVESSAANPR